MEHIKKEIRHLQKVFLRNGYSRRLIDRAVRPRPTIVEEEIQVGDDRQAGQTRKNAPRFLIYVKGTSEKIGKICRKYGQSPVFHKCNTEEHFDTCKGSTKEQGQGSSV